MKELLVKNEGKVLMDLDMAIEKFKGMVYDFAHNCENEFKKYEYNVDAFEDYCQIGTMELVKAYEYYNVNNEICFSTYLTTYLQNRFLMIYRKLNAKKRAVKNTVSLNKELEKTATPMEELIPTKKDQYFKTKENSLEQFIKDNLTKEEMIFLLMDIKKLTSNPSKILISSSSYALDVLGEEVDIDVKNLTRTELAKSLGITRPTLNSRIKKSVAKAQGLTEIYLNKKD